MRNKFTKVLTVSPSANNPEKLMRISRLLDIDKSKLVAEGSALHSKVFDNRRNIKETEENFGSTGTGVMPNSVNRNQCGQ